MRWSTGREEMTENYYERLERMEREGELEWADKPH
jgi:hypothetical protein